MRELHWQRRCNACAHETCTTVANREKACGCIYKSLSAMPSAPAAGMARVPPLELERVARQRSADVVGLTNLKPQVSAEHQPGTARCGLAPQRGRGRGGRANASPLTAPRVTSALHPSAARYLSVRHRQMVPSFEALAMCIRRPSEMPEMSARRVSIALELPCAPEGRTGETRRPAKGPSARSASRSSSTPLPLEGGSARDATPMGASD